MDQTGDNTQIETIDTDPESRPCHEPLVWTVNDDYGGNEPDLGELADTCQELGCVPYCTPGPSQTCVKYSEWTGKHLSYTSQVRTMDVVMVTMNMLSL